MSDILYEKKTHENSKVVPTYEKLWFFVFGNGTQKVLLKVCLKDNTITKLYDYIAG